MPRLSETIAAIATPLASSALGIVRFSGPTAVAVAASAFGRELPPRRAVYTRYQRRDGDAVDDGIALLYPAANSFTGEDLVEFSGHGNPLILQLILDDLIERGCRLAEPGEFTRTAYLNGRLGLTEAEAVADVIAARSEAALENARRQLGGGVGKEIETIVDQIVTSLAALEAYIDFPEEDLPPEDRAGPVADLAAKAAELRSLADTGRLREILESGIRITLFGPTNAGKSSLLNALCGRERALVSDTAGTTRDFIEVEASLGAYRIHFVDTAGFRDGAEGLEAEGIRLTERELAHSDILLAVLDGSAAAPPPRSLLPHLESSRTLVVQNKSDLPSAVSGPAFAHPVVQVSAKTGAGLPELRAALLHRIDAGVLGGAAGRILYNQRHCVHLRQAADHLDEALTVLRTREETELAATEIRLALERLGAIVGRIDNERVLDDLFQSFCIGK